VLPSGLADSVQPVLSSGSKVATPGAPISPIRNMLARHATTSSLQLAAALTKKLPLMNRIRRPQNPSGSSGALAWFYEPCRAHRAPEVAVFVVNVACRQRCAGSLKLDNSRPISKCEHSCHCYRRALTRSLRLGYCRGKDGAVCDGAVGTHASLASRSSAWECA
jgi:hypothetical protein